MHSVATPTSFSGRYLDNTQPSPFVIGSTPAAGRTYADAPPIVDPCPAFTPPTYHRWKSDARLRLGSAPTATTSMLLAKIIAVLPHPSKRDGSPYMDQTRNSPESRTLQSLMDILGARYGKTESGRSWPWLNRFAGFARHPSGDLGDFWSRFLRTTPRMSSLGVQTPKEMRFSKSPCAKTERCSICHRFTRP